MADEETFDGEPGKRLVRVVFWGPEEGILKSWPQDEVRSKQLTEDPFQGLAAYGTLVRMPPYSLEQLVLCLLYTSDAADE